MLNFCDIVVAILKMATSRNCSMSRNQFVKSSLYPHVKWRWNRAHMNLCGIVVSILKMVTGRNFSMSGINSGHHNLPTYEMALKSDNCAILKMATSRKNGDQSTQYQIGQFEFLQLWWPFWKCDRVEIVQCRESIRDQFGKSYIYPHMKWLNWNRTMLNFFSCGIVVSILKMVTGRNVGNQFRTSLSSNFDDIGQCWIFAILWWPFWKWWPVKIVQCRESIRDIIIYPHIKLWGYRTMLFLRYWIWKGRPVEIFQCQESIRDIIIYPHMKWRWNQTMLNLCGIVVAILKMATGRNFSMSGINSGHIIYPHMKFGTSLSTHVSNWYRTMLNFLRYCGGHFENGDQ